MNSQDSGMSQESSRLKRTSYSSERDVEKSRKGHKHRSSHEDKKSKRKRSRSGSRERHRHKKHSRSYGHDSKKRKRSRSRSSSLPSERKQSHRDSYRRSFSRDEDRRSRYKDGKSPRNEGRRSSSYKSKEKTNSPVKNSEQFFNDAATTVCDREASLIQNNRSVLTVPTVDSVQMGMAERENKERRKSRWSSNKSFVPGLPTILPSDLDDKQTQIYLLTIEVEEITRKLRLNIFTSSTGERSPSPEPIYDNTGKRLNTREVRKKQELEQRRHEKITQLKMLNPEYKPPADYRPPNIKLHEKVWIPQDDHPEINFVGLLIGPRGNTLRSLEQETSAKIIIRGKGSIKEGKIRREGPMPGENEPLHAYVTGSDMTVIQKACEKIHRIIEDALSKPDANSLRQNQLRELAILNGTLRTEDILGVIRCTNCGSDQHKTYECSEQLNFTANITCPACGAAGHLARDCLAPRVGYQAANNEELDSEYSALMSEIAEVEGNDKKTQQTQAPFKLPPPQFNFQYNRPPVFQYMNSNRFCVSDLMFQFPQVWTDGQMQQEPNGNPMIFWPPPPPPPPSMPEE